MKFTWACLFVAALVIACVAEDYSTYDVNKQSHYGPVQGRRHYTRRCGVIPNVFREPRAERSSTSFGQYTWQAAILNGYDKNSFVCSGALLSSSDILTSASCVKSLPESYIRVRLGEWDITTDKNPSEAYANLELGVVKKIIHPQYKPGADYYPGGYDVAILKLEYAVDFSSYPQISPVCLPSHKIDLEYAECFVAGWSKSKLDDLKVSQYQSKFLDFDFINVHKEPYSEYPLHKETASDVHSSAVGPLASYISYDDGPKYKSANYEQSHYESPAYSSLQSSLVYNLTGIPLVTLVESRTLDHAQVLVKENYECDEYLRAHLQKHQLCVTGVNGYDVCKADLGSPVVCLVADPSYSPSRYRRDAYSSYKRSFTAGPGTAADSANTRAVVVGVSSLVYPCHSHKPSPAIATEVVKSLDFVLNTIAYSANNYY